jgi:hypothetical protein
MDISTLGKLAIILIGAFLLYCLAIAPEEEKNEQK